MSVEKIQRDLTNLFNYPSDPNPTTQADYINAVKNWVGSIVNLVDCGLWQPETAYEVGAIVRTPSLPVFALKCITAGTSDVTEPDYTDVSEGDTVTDNNVEWIICTINTENSDSKANVNASNIGVNAEIDNSELWGSAIGGGTVAEDDGKLVTGGTVYAVTNGLASDIADNTDDIATNTENIAQNATDIDIADKRISNIEKLLQGNLYDYQTDNTSAYTKTVPSGAMPYAGIEKIGGKTVVWNQYILDPHMTDATKWRTTAHPTSFSITITDNTLKVERVLDDTYNLQLTSGPVPASIQGHKYYLTAVLRCNSERTVRLDAGGANQSFTVDTTAVKCSAIVTASSISRLMVTVPGADFAQNDWLEVQDFWVCDLTLMFGAGNEPSTVAEFEAMFPADYYAYNAGELLSAGVTEVVSKDSNNATLQTYSIPAEVQSLEGYGWSAGSVYNYIDYERKVFVQNVARVDLGTRTWFKGLDSGHYVFVTSGITAKKNGRTNITCQKYPVDKTTTAVGIMIDYHIMGQNNSVDVFIRDDSFTEDANAFKTAMNGVYLYYELATPIETDISAYLTDDNLIEVAAGGTLTFPNQNGTDYQIPVPSEETYMIDLQEAINNG